MQHFVVGMLFLIMTGCATQAEQRGLLLKNKFDEAAQRNNACLERAINTQEYIRLNHKYILYRPDDEVNRFEKMANKEFATDQDIKDFIAQRQIDVPCRSQSQNDLGAIDYRYANLMASTIQDSDETLLALVNREISIGDYNQKRVARHNKFREIFAQIGNAINAELNQFHANEMQNRQAAAAAFAGAMQQHQIQQQQQFNNMQQQQYQQQLLNLQRRQVNIQQQQLNNLQNQRHTSTNCYFVGNSLQCDSY